MDTVYTSKAGGTGASLDPIAVAVEPLVQALAKRADATITAVLDKEAENSKKQLTTKEWKNLLRLYFTIRRSTVQACGHKIDLQGADGPRTNCQLCWFAFFNNNGELVQSIDEMLSTSTVADPAGITAAASLISMRGVKFVKNFRKFMSTIATWKKQMEKANDDHNSSQVPA